MAAQTAPITYTDIEVRSLLPSGWGIVTGAAGRWDAKSGRWSIDVFDGAENSWTVTVDTSGVDQSGRLGALDAQIRRLERKGLGRKSVISG